MHCPYCGRDISAHFPLSTAQRRVLEAVDAWHIQSSIMIADRAGYSVSYTCLILTQLVHLELVQRKGRRGGFFLPSEEPQRLRLAA
mgnify:CR=1 FL=1